MSGYQQHRPAPGKQPMPARLKDYRAVSERIDAFCADYPGETQIVTEYAEPPAEGWIAFRAHVIRRMPDGTAWTLGSGHAAKKFLGQEDELEKLETASRGRALVAAGYTSSLEKAAEIAAATEKVNRQESERNERGDLIYEAPQDAPEPLTDDQERIVAEARDMASQDQPYPAVVNHLRQLQTDATPDQWTLIRRALAAIKAAHYAQPEEA